jgi:hypothetical protein
MRRRQRSAVAVASICGGGHFFVSGDRRPRGCRCDDVFSSI